MMYARGRRIRPLLDCSRGDIVAYARHFGLSWIEDESNGDSRFRRNFLRRDVIPLLEQKFPQAIGSLARAAGSFSDSAELLDQLARMDMGDTKLLKVSQLRNKDPLRAANMLAYHLRQHGLMIPSGSILREMLRQILTASCDSQICFTVGDSLVRRFRDQIFVEPQPAKVFPRAWSFEPSLDWGAYRIRCCQVRGDGIAASGLAGKTLVFESRRAGDAMRLRVGGPRRPLKDLLREAGVPPWRRKTLPILYAGNEIVWVAGIGIASEYRCKPEAEGILIEFDGVTW